MTVKIDGVEPNIFPDVDDLDARDAGRNVEVFLESVREHHLGLHSFRSMRRIEASLRKASALRLRHSQSLASLRHRPSQAKVRSTSQRFGSTTKRWASSERLTISTFTRLRIVCNAFWKPAP